MGRLHTCYAPVRRSPSNQASLINAAPRLACVKPIASVHPEPGSNSSLLYFLASFAFLSSLTVRFFLSLILHFVVSSFQRTLALRLCLPPLVCGCFLVESGCKGRPFYFTYQIFSNLFLIYFLLPWISVNNKAIFSLFFHPFHHFRLFLLSFYT